MLLVAVPDNEEVFVALEFGLKLIEDNKLLVDLTVPVAELVFFTDEDTVVVAVGVLDCKADRVTDTVDVPVLDDLVVDVDVGDTRIDCDLLGLAVKLFVDVLVLDCEADLVPDGLEVDVLDCLKDAVIVGEDDEVLDCCKLVVDVRLTKLLVGREDPVMVLVDLPEIDGIAEKVPVLD